MFLKTIRSGLFAATVATAFLAVPAESHAIFHWFSGCCGGNSAPAYAPAPQYGVAAAPADACCAPPQVSQTVNYVPQTCYRTQYVSVPVTTYRPVTGRDPCTGCPVTCMQPTTSVVQQARMVPYTTYRMVLSNPCTGGITPVTTGYTPMYRTSVGYAGGSSCSSCSAASPMTYAPAASAPYYGGTTSGTVVGSASGYAQSNGTVSNGTVSNGAFSNGAMSSGTLTNGYSVPGNLSSSSGIGSSSGSTGGTPTPAPPLNGSGRSGNPTFRDNKGPMLQKPIPPTKDETPPDDDDNSSDSSATSGAGATLSPRLFQPHDRTTSTSYPILRVGTHRPVSYRETTPEPAKQPSRPVDDGGWRPSTR
ncbi:MAG TPA: hypothetical protein VHC22_00440 [Pirellulales bacterium]|nr:hypothetical protein [Pirellulales bacterium]